MTRDQENANTFLGRPMPNPIVFEIAKLVSLAVRAEPDIWAIAK